jgi:hypothetical protein
VAGADRFQLVGHSCSFVERAIGLSAAVRFQSLTKGEPDDLTVRLEQAAGTPAEPPSIGTTVTNWRTGDTIPIAAGRSLRVVGIGATNEDEPPVLIVEDVS